MKILVIFTGGTIGSRKTDAAISPNRDTKYLLINDFEKKRGKVCDFVCREPYFALSENLDAATLNLLVSEVKKGSEEDFDGIIVTHGTDTLQFSAAAAAFGVKTEIPVVFVSSNYPLSDARANGTDNFNAAVKFILEGGQKGVFISYKNPYERVQLLPANKVYSFLEDDDRLYEAKREVLCPVSDFTLTDSSGILVIDPHPADGYYYDLDGVKAVIFRPYHSGTLATNDLRLGAFCEKAAMKNIPLFLCGGAEGVTYESASRYTELHVIPLPRAPFAATYMKLWIGISIGAELKEFMKG